MTDELKVIEVVKSDDEINRERLRMIRVASEHEPGSPGRQYILDLLDQ